MTRAILAAAASLSLTACGLRPLPVRGYVPNPPLDPAPRLPRAVAVAPLEDRAPAFKFQGRKFPYLDGTFNLLRGGDPGYFIPALDARAVAGFLRDDLEASAAFASVRLLGSAAEAAPDEVLVSGFLDKAEYVARSRAAGGGRRLILSLTLRAQDAAGRVIWEKPFYSVEDVGGPDRIIAQSVIASLRDFFAAARRDLVAALAAQP